MSVDGTLPPAFLRSDPGRLELLGVRFVQVEAKDLVAARGRERPRRRARPPDRRGAAAVSSPCPSRAATEIRIESSLSDAVLVPQDAPVAVVSLRLASGRTLPVPLRAGVDTAEWAFDRPDVTGLMKHRKAEVLETFRPEGAAFPGRRYLGVLRLHGRYLVDGIGILEASRGRGGFPSSARALRRGRAGAPPGSPPPPPT